jgi:hyperosmotically inducible protein
MHTSALCTGQRIAKIAADKGKVFVFLSIQLWTRGCSSRKRMKFTNLLKLTAIALSLSVCASWTETARAQEPDNTKVNKRDKNPGEATADQQKMNPADRDLSAKIRKAVMADKTLSTYAHNVKIISQDGVVTLKGPVRSDDEAKAIVAKAVDVTGSADKVVNQMSVKP